MAGSFEVAPTKNGKTCWRLKAGNGEIILASQQYKAKSSALKGIASVQSNCGDDSCFERKEAKNKKPYFVMKAKNGQVIGTSEMYNSTKSMENGIASIKKNAPTAKVKDLT